MFKTEEISVLSPSEDLRIVTRIRPFRRHMEWQIQVRGVLMSQGKGGLAALSAGLYNVANDLDIHGLAYAAGEARALALSMDPQ